MPGAGSGWRSMRAPPLMLEGWIAVHALLTFVTLVVEAIVGYPAWLNALIPHPVVWAGTAINALERRWNKPQYSFNRRRLFGWGAVVLVTGAAVLLGAALETGALLVHVFYEMGGRFIAAVMSEVQVAVHTVGIESAPTPVVTDNPYGLPVVPDNPYGSSDVWGSPWPGIITLLVLALVASTGLAQKSLFVHVRNVLTALRARDLSTARERVSLIVGRDTRQLDESGVSAAALESLAESFNDGIVAPAFWLLVGGLPGLFAYKVLNTADSLIGHKEERWRAFGWAAARADDVANLIPARIAGTLLAIAGRGGFGVMFKDASKHASPNAGWPEAAMAGALGVRLGGPTSYDGVVHERPVFGSGERPGWVDLRRGLRIYVVACLLLWVLVAAPIGYLLLRALWH
jgi:adenosylcobinamide-phosphate synthase